MQTEISAPSCILTAERIKRAIRRMAFQIAENNATETSIILAGIIGNGTVVAGQIRDELSRIINLPVVVYTVSLNKKKPLDATINSEMDFNGQVIILIDDVSNTGKTLLYALKPFLHFEPKKIQTLVLVERSHKLFAVQPDYVGLSVATTLQEHISVEIDGKQITGAWLY
ncbi:MAG: phosphoribosyltransferase family protein [Chitinophagaceae bacterium]